MAFTSTSNVSRWRWFAWILMSVFSLCQYSIVADTQIAATSSPVAEYCQTEIFQATCAEDEVVMVETAQYGRLDIGRCVTGDFGYLRCLHDVMLEVESACSGRRSCRLRVDDVTFSRATPCHRDLKSNLLAAYRCTKVIVPNAQCKSPPGGESIIDITPTGSSSTSGLISSHVTEETGCGTADWPWTIRAGPGQRINLTMYDFSREASAALGGGDINSGTGIRHHSSSSSDSASGSSSTATCRVYATIRDGNGIRSTTVCGGKSRLAVVFTSATNRVEIRFLRQPKTPSTSSGSSAVAAAAGGAGGLVTNTESHFLLRYDVLGCVDPIMYPGMKMDRNNDVISIRCDVSTSSSDVVWQMTCVGNKWIGSYGNCTNGNEGLVSGIFTAPPAIIIVVIAIFVVCFILTIGTLCIKWRLRKDYGSSSYPTEVRTEPVDLIPEYDYQYHIGGGLSGQHHVTGNEKLGNLVPIRTAGGRYLPQTPANYDATVSAAAVLAGNEYATMRLLQMAPYTDMPPPPPAGSDLIDRSYSGADTGSNRTSGCMMTDHIYESPDSMRRIPFIPVVSSSGQQMIPADDFDPVSCGVVGSKQVQARLLPGGSHQPPLPPPQLHQQPSGPSSNQPQWNRARLVQQQMSVGPSGPSVGVSSRPSGGGGGVGGGGQTANFNGDRYETPVSCSVGSSNNEQRFAGNYSL